MASGETDYLENELLDHALRNATWTPPATIYLALYTTALTTGTWRAFGTLTPNFANHADALEMQVRVRIRRSARTHVWSHAHGA